MTRIIDRFRDISGAYDAAFCDVWGCVHDGLEHFPRAAEALTDYIRTGGTVVLLTNSPRPSKSVQMQLRRIGVPEDCWNLVVTSGDAARDALFAGQAGRKIYHIGPDAALGFIVPETERQKQAPRISTVPLADAEGIVCTGLFDDETETPEDYRAMLSDAVEAGLKMLCANPDIVVDRGSHRVYCAGALARLYDQLGGETLLFGKPRRAIYELATRRLRRIVPGLSKRRIICIGDGIATDIGGAARNSLDSLFVTGGLAARETGTEERPDPAKLAAFLRQSSASPEYAIGKLC